MLDPSDRNADHVQHGGLESSRALFRLSRLPVQWLFETIKDFVILTTPNTVLRQGVLDTKDFVLHRNRRMALELDLNSFIADYLDIKLQYTLQWIFKALKSSAIFLLRQFHPVLLARHTIMAGLFLAIPFNMREMTDGDVKLIAAALSFPQARFSSTILHDTKSLITSLPRRLKRPIPFQDKVVSALAPARPYMKPCGILCSTHKPLNGQIVHFIFDALSLEIGVRLNALISYPQLPRKYLDLLRRLRELHAMWLEPRVYERTFLESPTSRWHYQSDRCEACILARIGGQTDILSALRTAALSRRVTGTRSPPRVLRLVEAWVDLTRHAREIRARSDADGVELRSIRKSARKAGKGGSSRERGGEYEWKQTDLKDDAEDSDLEGKIVDHYAALVSTPYLPLDKQTTVRSPRRDSDIMFSISRLDIADDRPSSSPSSRYLPDQHTIRPREDLRPSRTQSQRTHRSERLPASSSQQRSNRYERPAKEPSRSAQNQAGSYQNLIGKIPPSVAGSRTYFDRPRQDAPPPIPSYMRPGSREFRAYLNSDEDETRDSQRWSHSTRWEDFMQG